MSAPRVTSIKLHKQSQRLSLAFADGTEGELDAEFLRINSPSAEVQGYHGQPELVEGKAHVKILDVQAVGRYAVRLIFNDGHDSGIYTWQWLHHLTTQEQSLKEQYRQRIAEKQAQQALQIPISVNYSGLKDS